MRRHKIDGSGEMHLSALKLKRGLESFISRLRPKSPKEVLPELWYINSFLHSPILFLLFFSPFFFFFFLTRHQPSQVSNRPPIPNDGSNGITAFLSVPLSIPPRIG